jgi:trimethylamine--corrinoid protein Co-methyltransferase
MFTCRQENVNLILHCAGILDSYSAMSYEQFLVDLEIIGMVECYLKGLRLGEDALSVDLIKKVGPGGQFLSQPDTMKKCRTEPWMPEIGFRGTLKNETAQEAILRNIQQKKEEMLNAYQMPPLEGTVKSQLTDYLEGIGIDPQHIEKG